MTIRNAETGAVLWEAGDDWYGSRVSPCDCCFAGDRARACFNCCLRSLRVSNLRTQSVVSLCEMCMIWSERLSQFDFSTRRGDSSVFSEEKQGTFCPCACCAWGLLCRIVGCMNVL